MDLRLLGPVRAWRDEAELPLGSARRMAVLAVLALHAGHAVSRQQLVTALWGDDPPASAIGNVYTYVSTLRRVLEPARDRWSAGQLLTSGGGSYCLHIRKEDVDVFRFEALREESRRHRAANDRLAELAALEVALGLWHGDALSGLPGPYAEAQRLRLAELRLATAERHAAVLIELDRHDQAVGTLHTLVEAYPLQENLHGMLMAALQATGRQAEALRVHDDLSKMLLEETGTEPSAPLRAIRDQILTVSTRDQQPAARPSSTSDPVALVGRDAELDLLRRAVADVAAGNGGSIRVEGAPGLGKSALLTVALRTRTPRGCRTGWGAGDELARRMPLGVLLECMESAMSGDAPPDVVRQLFMVAADAIDGPHPRIVEQAVDLVRQAATAAPLILVADDLQRADVTTLRVWSALHELTRELPLLLVAATRPGAPELAGVPASLIVTLAPLAMGPAGALARAVATGPRDRQALHRLLTDAGGNPYYLRLLAAGGRETLAPELIAAVNAHLAAFGEGARQLLRACAFLGDNCTLAEVAAVTGRAAAELARAVAPVRTAGVLTADEETLTFRHHIVARVLHESTPMALRVLLHRSFAEKIAEQDGAADKVLDQLQAGPVPLDAAVTRWLTRFVERLAGRTPRAAIDMLRRIRTDFSLDEPTRLRLTACLARLRYGQGDNAVADAGWVVARTSDVDLEAEMQWIIACSLGRHNDHAAAADVARAALSSRAYPEPWLGRFRLLIGRLRPHLPGPPTVPHLSRSELFGDYAPATR
ncbi:BTAD domain-containing putative transcriptional regulator [Actinoplanes sp. NPDC051859]|uniref:BTAD domain-containing putative transcriptional regulator n=1 Tax=Actinoplanes sp. NPDC051859 TaxID=3363909 RepID=UPI00379DBCCD